jgi:transketolase
MRTAFSDALVSAARADSRVLLLTGDHGYALFDDFRRNCPDQYINAGVAEQNMVGVAAGLAKGGFRPVVYGLGAFVPVRVLEQVKIDLCFEKLPVVLIGDGAGVVYSHLGSSHQTTEDIAALRALPGIAILSPGDRSEMTYCMEAALRLGGPAYVRMGKADLGAVHAGLVSAPLGALLPVLRGDHRAAIIATGSMLKTALDIGRKLGGIEVWSAPAIKPLDDKQVEGICAGKRVVIVMEEHSVYGGLGSAVAEISSAAQPVRVVRIGVPDQFSHSCGTYAHLLREHGIDAASVELRVRQELAAANIGAKAENAAD